MNLFSLVPFCSLHFFGILKSSRIHAFVLSKKEPKKTSRTPIEGRFFSLLPALRNLTNSPTNRLLTKRVHRTLFLRSHLHCSWTSLCAHKILLPMKSGLIKTAARKDRTVLQSRSLCKQPSSLVLKDETAWVAQRKTEGLSGCFYPALTFCSAFVLRQKNETP